VADAVAGSLSTFAAIRLVLLIFGPMTALTLVIVCWLASVSGWRAAVCAPGGRYRAEGLGAGALLAVGMVVGEPLSVIYANAGTWGVWDTTLGYRIGDVAGSAAVILVVAMGLYGWAAECAAVWRPVLRGGPRRMVALTAAVAAVGALPVVLTWTASHNTLALTAVVTAGSEPLALAGFPAQGLLRSQYLAPFFAVSLPGVAVALALPGLFVAVGALRRARLALPRPPAFAGRTVAAGVVGAALTVEVALVATELVRALVGVRGIAEATDVGAGPYFFQLGVRSLASLWRAGHRCSPCGLRRTGLSTRRGAPGHAAHAHLSMRPRAGRRRGCPASTGRCAPGGRWHCYTGQRSAARRR